MYWSNADLKSRARQQLQGRWGKYILISFLYTLITTALSYIADLVLPKYTDLGTWLYAQSARQSGMEALLDEMGLGSLLNLTFTVSDFAWNLGVWLVGLLLTVFVYQVLAVGLCRWFMEARGAQPQTSTLFSGFTNGDQWRNVAKVRFWVLVYTWLWSLLFVIPGLVYSYKTVLVPYLLAENPYMTKKRAIELSKALTQGEKMRIFWLQFSFFGWFLLYGMFVGLCSTVSVLLGTVASTVGMLVLAPYIDATMAELYATMREKAFRMGYSDESELAGFAV